VQLIPVDPRSRKSSRPPTLDEIVSVASGSTHASPGAAWIHRKDEFTAGSLGRHIGRWEKVLTLINYPAEKTSQVLRFLRGVRPSEFACRFTGHFKGRKIDPDEPSNKAYDASSPPAEQYRNHHISDEHRSFVRDKYEQLVRWGGLTILGRISALPIRIITGLVILPTGVEPTKPRMVLDARHTNNFSKCPQHTLRGLQDVPGSVPPDSEFGQTDHTSGYTHVMFHAPAVGEKDERLTLCTVMPERTAAEEKRPDYDPLVVQYNCMPFGWRPASFVYTCLSDVVVAFLRHFGHPAFGFIDDIGVTGKFATERSCSAYCSARDAMWVSISIQSYLGWFFSPAKNDFWPSFDPIYLGTVIDLRRRAFYCAPQKLKEWNDLRVSIIRAHTSRRKVSLWLLERFQGKAIHLSLAVPMMKLFMREVQAAMRMMRRSGASAILISDELASDMGALEPVNRRHEAGGWDGSAWLNPQHASLDIRPLRTIGAQETVQDGGAASCFTDASSYRWGGIFRLGSIVIRAGGDFTPEELKLHINEQEALASLRTAQAVVADPAADAALRDIYLDFNLDSMVVFRNLMNDGGRNLFICRCAKEMALIFLMRNVIPRFGWVATDCNPDADEITREDAALDSRLDDALFGRLWDTLGPFSADLMATPASARQDPSSGRVLPFFSRFAVPPQTEHLGVGALAHPWTGLDGAYCFPPFALVAPALAHALEQRVRVTILWPMTSPPRPWQPKMLSAAHKTVVVAERGEQVLWRPAKGGRVPARAPARICASLLVFDA